MPWHPFPNKKKDLQNMYTGQVDADSLSPVCIVIKKKQAFTLSVGPLVSLHDEELWLVYRDTDYI